jgi:hypothetical protein
LSKEVGTIQTKKVDKFLKKILPPKKYQKETFKTDIIKGKVHKEIVLTSVLKQVIRISVNPEVVRNSVLKTTIIDDSDVVVEGTRIITTTVHNTDDVGTTVHGFMEQ